MNKQLERRRLVVSRQKSFVETIEQYEAFGKQLDLDTLVATFRAAIVATIVRF
jgi:hypothetical protein